MLKLVDHSSDDESDVRIYKVDSEKLAVQYNAALELARIDGYAYSRDELDIDNFEVLLFDYIDEGIYSVSISFSEYTDLYTIVGHKEYYSGYTKSKAFIEGRREGLTDEQANKAVNAAYHDMLVRYTKELM
jgi:hypothetical protein